MDKPVTARELIDYINRYLLLNPPDDDTGAKELLRDCRAFLEALDSE